MKFKAPGRRKKNKSVSNDEDMTAALAGDPVPTQPEPIDSSPTEATPPEVIEPQEEEAREESSPEAEAPEEEPTEEEPTEEATQEEPAPVEEEEEIAEEAAEAEDPNVILEEPEAEEQEAEEEDLTPTSESPPQLLAPLEPPVPSETPENPAEEAAADEDNFVDAADEVDDEPPVSVELSPISPLTGNLKKGPYLVPNASPKSTKTLRKQKWASQFCRMDPALMQIFCCDPKLAKLYETHAPVETDGKCMFFHINHFTNVTEGIEEDSKAKDFTFKITGLNGGPDNTLTMSTSTSEEREKWVRCIRRSVNRIHIDQDRLGSHTKLRQMLTGQEAEISILEEELEKMAVVAGECSGRANLAEEKLKLQETESNDVNNKLELSKIEIASLRQQLSILEERTRNLNILADDVHGTTPEEVEAAREQMQSERAKRLKAIQLEIGGDEDYLEKYKKYLNLRRDSILQKHGSQYSVNNLGIGQPKMSPSSATAPMSLN